MNDILYTPANSVQILNKVKDSKFYGSIARVDNEEDVKEFVVRIKNMYSDATHNVSAYLLGVGDQAFKYTDDDGEPAGSSGPPVLQAIEGENLTNTVIVVTRYFGGTKLGIGGLIRAYGNTARLVIKEAGVRKLELYQEIHIKGNYDNIGIILGQIEAAGGSIKGTEYGNQGVVVSIKIKPEKWDLLKGNLIEKTGNRIEFKIVDNIYK